MRGVLLFLLFVPFMGTGAAADPGKRLLEALSWVPVQEEGLSASLPLRYVDLAAIERAFGFDPPARIAGLDSLEYFNHKRRYSHRAFVLFGGEGRVSPASSPLQSFLLVIKDQWPETLGFDLAAIDRALFSGPWQPFADDLRAIAVLMLRPGSADEGKMTAALEASSRAQAAGFGTARRTRDAWWEAMGLHPLSVLTSFDHGFGKPADDALVAVGAGFQRSLVDALQADRAASLARHPKLRALLAAIHSDEQWQQPLAAACFNTSSEVPPFVPDLLTLVFPLSGLPRSEVTLVAEQLKPGQGRLVFAAVYERAADAVSATRALEGRLRRWPLRLEQIWQASWRKRLNRKALHRGSPLFRPLTVYSLAAILKGETVPLAGDPDLWVALATLTYPLAPLGPLAEGETNRFDDGDNERQAAAVRANCVAGSWIFATATSGKGGSWLSDLPFE